MCFAVVRPVAGVLNVGNGTSLADGLGRSDQLNEEIDLSCSSGGVSPQPMLDVPASVDILFCDVLTGSSWMAGPSHLLDVF